MTLIQVKNLKKSFGELEVLKDINVEIQEREVVCVIGPSGSGKSTFLRCLNRLEDITAGHVVVDGQDITDTKRDINKIRENVGMVFQQFNLFPHMTVLQNVMLAPMKLGKGDKNTIEKKALELLVKVGLSDKAKAYPGELSGGKSNVSRLPGRLQWIPKSCCLMNRHLHLTLKWSAMCLP